MTTTVTGYGLGTAPDGTPLLCGWTPFSNWKHVGTKSNDTIYTSFGAFNVYGDAGIDTAVFNNGSSESYRVNQAQATDASLGQTIGGPGVTYVFGLDAKKSIYVSANLLDVERVKFSDKAIALDMWGHAGDTVKLLGLVFGKEAVSTGGTIHVGQDTYTYTSAAAVGACLNQLDTSAMTATDLAQGLLNLKLGSNFTNEQEVALLLTNLTGSADPATVKTLAHDYLDSGLYTQATFATAVADLAINKSYINFTGLQTNGVEFV